MLPRFDNPPMAAGVANENRETLPNNAANRFAAEKSKSVWQKTKEKFAEVRKKVKARIHELTAPEPAPEEGEPSSKAE